MSQQGKGLFAFPLGEKKTNARRGDRLFIGVLQIVRANLRTALIGPRAQIADAARRAGAEMKIAPHVKRVRNRIGERRLEEALRGLRGELGGERQHHHGVDTGLGKCGYTALVGHELLQTVGVEALVGIDVERERDRNTAVFSRSLLRLIDKEAMPLVHTVKHAESARCARQHAIVERGIYVKNLCHGLLLGKIHSRA